MDELELVRLHEDGERLVLTGPDGTQSTLPITDALRAAVRGDRPRMENIRAHEESTLRPREIQARLRAGATCEELAEASGLPVEHVRRFEYPVVAERDYAISRVRARAVMSDAGPATLGEVADSRLTSRGVAPEAAAWTATRAGSAPWIVRVDFETADKPRTARWSFDPRGMVVTALDDEARWLALPEDDGGIALAGVSALSTRRARPPAPAPESDETDLLLDDLSERRGQRPSRARAGRPPDEEMLELGDLTLAELDPRRGAEAGRDEPAEAAEPAPAQPEAEPAASVVDLGTRRGGGRPAMPGVGAPTPDPAPAEPPRDDLPALEWDGPSRWEIPEPEAPAPAPVPVPAPARSTPGSEDDAAKAATAAKPAARRSARKGRAQVPSWDEIVFGARPEG